MISTRAPRSQWGDGAALLGSQGPRHIRAETISWSGGFLTFEITLFYSLKWNNLAEHDKIHILWINITFTHGLQLKALQRLLFPPVSSSAALSVCLIYCFGFKPCAWCIKRVFTLMFDKCRLRTVCLIRCCSILCCHGYTPESAGAGEWKIQSEEASPRSARQNIREVYSYNAVDQRLYYRCYWLQMVDILQTCGC